MPPAHHHSKNNEKPSAADNASDDIPGVDDSQDNGQAKEMSQKSTPQAPKMITISDLELEALRKELAETKDKYLRVLAESENARKRLQKEKQEMVQYAIQSLVAEFLTPIDHMENALGFAQQMSDEVKHWAVGFQMILSQFKDVLTINGVASFPSEGMHFDPHRHEAVETVETTKVPPGTVVEECLKGYTMGDKIIRPARVKVSKAPADEKQNIKDSQNE